MSVVAGGNGLIGMTELSDFCMAAVIVSLLSVGIVVNKGLARRKNKILLFLVLDCFVAAAMTAIGQYIPSMDLDPISADLAIKICLYIYHAFHSIFAILFVMYVIEAAGQWHEMTWTWLILLILPTIIFLIALAFNPETNWVFTVYDMAYYRGEGIYMEYAFAMIDFLIVIALMLVFRNAIGRVKLFRMAGFFFLSMIGVVVQMLIPEYNVEMFIESVSLIGLVALIENLDELINPTTNLYNKETFLLDNKQFIATRIEYAVLVIRLNKYEHMVTALGAAPILEITKDIAAWIHENATTTDCYDLENGVFAVILRNKKTDHESLIQKFFERFSESWTCNDLAIQFNTDLFYLNIPQDMNSINEIMSVLGAQPDDNSGGVRVLRGEKLSFIKRESMVEAALRRGLKEDALKVFYQPIFDTKQGVIHSAEALARFEDSELGYINPEEFIHVAEKSALIPDVGERVFEIVCRDISSGKLADAGIDFVEVNLSPVQCMKEDLDKDFQKIMQRYGVTTDDINLEVTESAVEMDSRVFFETIDKLKKLGFHFSLDDYGTGISNISSLFNMKFHIIKIDKSILWNADKSDSARMILDSIIRMILSLNIKIVTEGVETEFHKDMLTSAGVEYLQGYLFSAPVELDKFVRITKEYNRLNSENG